jgi:predicted transcriptional regulator
MDMLSAAAMHTRTPKQAARRLVERLDDDASFEDIQYELYVVQQIERGLREVEEGKTVTHEEARRRLGRWLDSEPYGHA